MAKRPVFIPHSTDDTLVKTESVEFQWFPGLAVSQKQKSIAALHASTQETLGINRTLEISSKSLDPAGVALSAFNLMFTTVRPALTTSVECAFQGSKVFEGGGPFTDIFTLTSLEAKKDSRLKESGRLIGFKFFGVDWELEPQTAFYDWLYLNAIQKNEALCETVLQYEAFTDIEFNPERSINCQAYSVALFVALSKRGILTEVIENKEIYLKFITTMRVSNARQNELVQPSLFF